MLNVGTPELLVVLLVGLLVLGPTKLPEVARQIGKAVAEIRRLGAGFQAEMRDALQEPMRVDPAPPESTADDVHPQQGDDAPPDDDAPDDDAPAADGDLTNG